jgi:hypothetical protein
MKLEEYLAELNLLVTERPELLKLDVITSGDGEGNYFNHVHYHPTYGHLDEDGDFIPRNSDDFGRRILNAVCLN